jgi:medium-chain acyl-[acyl-carrier-protein] hydrolase
LSTDRTVQSDSWFVSHKPHPQARLRLFCFPYAGGGAAIFHGWPKLLPSTVEVYSIQLPGRGRRLMEKPFTRMPELVAAISQAMLSHLDKPFAFFGHSLGAIVSFEVSRLLRREHQREPQHLFVSGSGAPQTSRVGQALHDLPDSRFLKGLRELDGTPREILESNELMQLLLPTLRADFAISETYVYRPEPPLDCPITAFGGLQDQEVSRKRLEAWRNQTNAAFSLQMFAGDHFFLHDAEPLLQALTGELKSVHGTLKV